MYPSMGVEAKEPFAKRQLSPNIKLATGIKLRTSDLVVSTPPHQTLPSSALFVAYYKDTQSELSPRGGRSCRQERSL